MNFSLKIPGEGLRRHVSGALYIIVQPLALNLISLPVTAYIIRSLGAAGYGTWATATTLAGTLSFLTNLGLRMYFVRSVARDPESAEAALSEQLGTRALLATLAATLATLACAALRYPPIVLACTIITGIGIVLGTISTTFADLLQAFARFRGLAAINLAAGLILTGASIVAVWLKTGPAGVAAAYLIGPICSVLLGYLMVRARICPVRVRWDIRRIWHLLVESRVLGLQLFTAAMGNQAESLLIPKIVGIGSYGFFAAGMIVPSRLVIVPDGLNTAFYPAMSRDFRASARMFIRTTVLFLVATVGACTLLAIGISALAEPLSRLLFPHQASICRRIMQVTVWTLPVIALASGIGYALNSCGREKTECTCSLISNAVGLVISVAFVLKFGLIGACYSILLRNVLSALVRIPALLQIMNPGCHPRATEQPAEAA